MPLDARLPDGWATSVCPHDCPSTCALEVEVLDERRIGKVRGGRRNPYTAGVICAKVARYAERQHHPDRLTQPLRRVGDKGTGRAAFQEISWEAALDLVAEGLTAAEQRHGPEAVWPYFYAGTMGHVQRDGIERLRHAKGYSRQWSTICVTLADSGWLAGVGAKKGVDAREIATSDLVVVWGGNPVSTQVNVMTHIARAKKANGAKLVVIDPYRTGTAEQADLHLALKPGTDAALACAVIHVLLRDGLADRAYLPRYSDWNERIEAHFTARDPAWAAAITGLDVEEIEAFARLYGATKKSYLRVGYGFSRSRNGAANLHAVSCLPAVTGAWAVEGGGALWGNGAIYNLDKTLIEGLDAAQVHPARSLDQSRFGPVLTGDPRDLGEGPPVEAIFVQNTNPIVVCPESAKCRDGLARDDLFVAVHEQFLTETAAMADVVLPATMFMEHDDYYTASGHTFLQVAKAVVAPPEGCRSNHEVICALAERLGADHPGFGLSAWELIDATFRASGHPGADEVHAMGGLDCGEDFATAHFLEGFPQPGGRFRFEPDWTAMTAPVSPGIRPDTTCMPPLPDHWTAIDEAKPDAPFRLVAAPARSYLNTTFTETPSSQAREARPEVLMHPETCTRLGLDEGERVRIGNDLGSLVVPVRPFDGLQPDVLVIESIWPNEAFEEGIGVNLLVSADMGAPRGGAVFHDTAVWARKAD